MMIKNGMSHGENDDISYNTTDFGGTPLLNKAISFQQDHWLNPNRIACGGWQQHGLGRWPKRPVAESCYLPWLGVPRIPPGNIFGVLSTNGVPLKYPILYVYIYMTQEGSGVRTHIYIYMYIYASPPPKIYFWCSSGDVHGQTQWN